MLNLDNIDILKKYGSNAEGVEEIRRYIYQLYIELDYRLETLAKMAGTGGSVSGGGNVVPSGNKLPASIEFVTYPNKLIYQGGEAIDLSGSVVRALMQDGTPWTGDDQHPYGIIPSSELILDPEVAPGSGDVYEKDGVLALRVDFNTELNAPNPLPYTGYKNAAPFGEWEGDDRGTPVTFYDFYACSQPTIGMLTRYNGKIYGVAVEGGVYKSYLCTSPQGNWIYGWGTNHPFYSSTVFSNDGSIEEDTTRLNLIKGLIPVSPVNPVGIDFSDATQYKPQIKTIWKRIVDERELYTFFQIAVE